MHIFNKNIDLYTIGYCARRVGLRAIGLIVALFSTRHANAVSITDVCPNCALYGGAICDSTYSSTFDDGRGIGKTFAGCIHNDNRGAGYPRFLDATCVSLLKSWGLCSTALSPNGTYQLSNTGLSCVGGPGSSSGVYEDSTTYYNGSSYDYMSYTYYQGIEMVDYSATNSNSSMPYACCKTDSMGASTAYCCFSSGRCDYWLCGVCDGGVEVSGVNLSGVLSSTACSSDFQTYFSSAHSTGWCDGNSGIYVEGTGALLIAQACYGDSIINSAHMQDVFCGIVITSCHGDSGYYRTAALVDPLVYDMSGTSAFCANCPSDTHAPWQSGISGFSIYSTGSGITSCYASPNPNPATATDSCGIYELHIASSCTDAGDCEYVDCQYQE